MEVSIVIISHNMRGLVKNCLKSLFEDLNQADFSYTVTVIDNYGRDGLAELVTKRFPSVKYFSIPNKGLSQAINFGLRQQPAEYYLVLNPDVVLIKPGSIAQLLSYMKSHQEIGLLAPQLINPNGSIQLSTRRFPRFSTPIFSRTFLGRTTSGKQKLQDYLMVAVDHSETMTVDWILGAVMFLRQKAVVDAGYFDEKYFLYFEDTDFSRSLHQAGWQVVYYPEVRVIHYHERGSADNSNPLSMIANPLTRQHIRSWIYYFRKSRPSLKENK